MDAGHRARGAVVDPTDPCVRVRAPEHPGMQHAGQPHVAGVLGAAGHPLERVDA